MTRTRWIYAEETDSPQMNTDELWTTDDLTRKIRSSGFSRFSDTGATEGATSAYRTWTMGVLRCTHGRRMGDHASCYDSRVPPCFPSRVLHRMGWIVGLQRTVLILSLAVLSSCRAPTAPAPTAALPPTSVRQPTATPRVPAERSILFQDAFERESIDARWRLIDGSPTISNGELTAGRLQVVLELGLRLPYYYTVQYDRYQCNSDYGVLEFRGQLRIRFLSDGTTLQDVFRSGNWISYWGGTNQACYTHTVVVIRGRSFTVITIWMAEAETIAEGEVAENLSGSLVMTIRPQGRIDNLLITSP